MSKYLSLSKAIALAFVRGFGYMCGRDRFTAPAFHISQNQGRYTELLFTCSVRDYLVHLAKSDSPGLCTWLLEAGIDVPRQPSTYPRSRAATRNYSFFTSHVVSGIYLVHLATSDSPGHCTWLLGICVD